ncbi:hypothetical protein MNBD_ACTINO02-2916 [hydrothermal vent metagenome]|uniref:Uncharacterized protein n=1 Tax=hydrothermal vent metagenome TaxID=652676 RepID=A0A3B0T1U4_9ZZZZ
MGSIYPTDVRAPDERCRRRRLAHGLRSCFPVGSETVPESARQIGLPASKDSTVRSIAFMIQPAAEPIASSNPA